MKITSFMHSIYKFLLVTVLGFSSLQLLAQKSVLYNVSPSVSMEINPAHNVKNRPSYFTLPVLNYQEIRVNAGGLSYDDIFQQSVTSTGTSVVLDYNRLFSNLSKDNAFNLGVELGILGLGIANGKDYYSFSVKEKIVGQMQYSNDVLGLMINGVAIETAPNGTMKYRDASTGSLFMDMMHYREYALGYDRSINDRFSFGVRLKLLFGMSAISTNGMRIDVKSTNLDAMELSAYGKANISAPVSFDVTTDENGIPNIKNYNTNLSASYLTEMGNFGVALDLGMEFRPSDKWAVGLSITDLGSIKYKKNLKQVYTDSHYRYEGIDVSSSINKDHANYVSFSDAVDELVEHAKSRVKLHEKAESFSQTLPLQVYMNGAYTPVKWFEASMMLRHRTFQGYIDNGLYVGTKFHSRWIDFAAQYAWNSASRSGLGLGLNLKLGVVHLYTAVDNILPLMGTGYSIHSSYRMGLNFVLDRKKSRVY
ncbi:DUF5723 family protein [Halosquirtibacter xylanolyticus]|uniref:DUF5723 family protein n=1 Tax=Halosquirtibacter xylanolyticus TaxID=3374599 RepID=UPI003748806E|nr:DUF5723 family protein [Prolixibacteraceae bacterium]